MRKNEKFIELVRQVSGFKNIERKQIREIVIRTYGITSIHAINSKIDLLLAYGIIKKNMNYFPDQKRACLNTIYAVNQESVSKVLNRK